MGAAEIGSSSCIVSLSLAFAVSEITSIKVSVMRGLSSVMTSLGALKGLTHSVIPCLGLRLMDLSPFLCPSLLVICLQ